MFAMFGIDNRPESDDLRVRGEAYISKAYANNSDHKIAIIKIAITKQRRHQNSDHQNRDYKPV